MLRSMFSGVSGLRVHQTRMDVIANNIANVNTTAFKSSRVNFQEIYSQTLKSASSPANGGGRGGTNPSQVGLGISIASIDVLHMNGSAQRTDKATDLAIEGDGFFTVSDGSNQYYTRAGNFDMDRSGSLVTSGGLKLMGWLNDPITQQVETTGEPKEINLANLVLPPKATSSITFEGNLDNRALDGNGDIVPYTVSVFDAKGTEHKLTYTFTKTAE
ncbi:MAG: flagellar hook-basal body complex protein, partial [Firmicutes bacterium]|nr:flagellar hook-basal body complex protein [Bacillota bacterium]